MLWVLGSAAYTSLAALFHLSVLCALVCRLQTVHDGPVSRSTAGCMLHSATCPRCDDAPQPVIYIVPLLFTAGCTAQEYIME